MTTFLFSLGSFLLGFALCDRLKRPEVKIVEVLVPMKMLRDKKGRFVRKPIGEWKKSDNKPLTDILPSVRI